MDNKLCISTIVNQAYQKYIPVFLYFCLKSYPTCGIKLFLTEKLDKKYRGTINKLRKLGTVVLVENYGKEFPKKRPHELKTIRWLFEANDFNGYDYIYVGDIDIIICREKESLLDQHLGHCESVNLPYSNSVRPNSKRLSGLHFVKKNEYYEKMNDVIQKYRLLLKKSALRATKNEETLYKMVTESGFLLPGEWFRPHHGLHLGLWRKGPRKIGQRAWDLIGRAAYKGHYEYYLKLKNAGDPLFEEVTNLKVVVSMEKSLGKEFGVVK